MTNEKFFGEKCGYCAWWSEELCSLPQDPGVVAHFYVCRKTGLQAYKDSSACPAFVDNKPERREK